MKLSADYLKSILKYDRESGKFHWIDKRSGINKSAEPGFIQSGGYRQITIDGRPYYAHRLAWLFVTGEQPSGFIDHLDGNRLNNSISNLRSVDRKTNNENQRDQHKNKIGDAPLGVSQKNGRWRAAIKISGKSMHIGTFDSPDIAHDAYLKSKRELHQGCTI